MIITGPDFAQALRALVPNLPVELISVVIRVERDMPVIVETQHYATTEDGTLERTPGGDAYLALAEKFALIPYGATRPPEEREEFIAELMQCLRWAAAVTAYEAPTPGELEEVSARARALIAKHEGRS